MESRRCFKLFHVRGFHLSFYLSLFFTLIVLFRRTRTPTWSSLQLETSCQGLLFFLQTCPFSFSFVRENFDDIFYPAGSVDCLASLVRCRKLPLALRKRSPHQIVHLHNTLRSLIIVLILSLIIFLIFLLTLFLTKMLLRLLTWTSLPAGLRSQLQPPPSTWQVR